MKNNNVDNSKLSISNFNILGDKVLIKIVEVEKKHGLFLPESSKDEGNIGVVVAVGNGKVGKDTIEPQFKKDDTILFQKWSGNEINVNGEKYIILEFKNVIGVKQ